MNISDVPISKTKIIVPKRRAELLSRARLLSMLYELLDRKLILVTAPAGYGKTSLLIDLVHNNDLPVCWLSLDPLDQEPQRFIAYFIAAISERFSGFGGRSMSALNMLTNLEEGMERLLVTLVNEIYDEIDEHFILVLDDFHLLDEIQPVQYFVNRFIQLVDENCHVILASRSLSVLPDLTLLVAREQIGGLDFSDLSFRPEEIQSLLMQNQQVRISDEEARRLVEATEGWVTGLQFIDLSLARAGPAAQFQPSHGISVFDYLGQQVLERQPADLRLFLLRSSLLEEFDAAMCEAVLGSFYSEPQDWAGLIAAVIRRNLFALPVEAGGEWLRFHHLFRDFLQGRLLRERPDEITPILQGLARYHEGRAEWEKAYQFNRQLADVETLADLIERAGIPMYQRAMLTLESWLRDLPPSLLHNRPGLLSLRGGIEAMKGNAAEGVRLFDRAISKYRDEQNLPGLALGLARRGNTLWYLGNYADAIRDADEAIQLTESDDRLQWICADGLRVKGLSLYHRGYTLQSVDYLKNALNIYVRLNDTYPIPMLLMETGMVYAATGSYHEAKASYEKALEIWRRSGNLAQQAGLLNNLGVLHHHQGEYEQAAQALEEGLLCAQRGGFKRMEALTAMSLGDLYTDLDDFEVARRQYRQVRELVYRLGERFLLNYLTLAEANLDILQRNLPAARRSLEQAAILIQSNESNYEYALFELIRGRLSLLEGDPHRAVGELSDSKERFIQDGREMEIAWSRLWLAAAQWSGGEQRAASEEIKTAVPDPSQINHFTVVAARQAREWLEGLKNDPDLKRPLRVLFERAGRLETLLPRTRRQVRRLARTVEIPAPHLVIQGFGRGRVSVNGRLLTLADWQTHSVRELFYYFLTLNRPATKERIGDVLWPEALEPAKLKLRFKNEIYRLRRAVGQDTILFDHEYYRFNPAIDHEYDVEAFEGYLLKAESTAAAAEQIELYQKAIDLVHGSFLEDIDATWVFPERERLSQSILTAAMTLGKLYQEQGQAEKGLGVGQWAIRYDSTHEAAYRLMMQIYHRLGDRAAVLSTYQTCKETMLQMFNMAPSPETEALYRQLIT